MNTPWPNARVAAGHDAVPLCADLSSAQIIQGCQAQAAAGAGNFLIQILFLPSWVSKVIVAYGLGEPNDETAFGLFFMLSVYALAMVFFAISFKNGGFTQTEALTKLFHRSNIFTNNWKFWQAGIFVLCACVLVSIFARPWVENIFNMPPNGAWLFFGLFQMVFLPVQVFLVYVWWRRGETVARNGAMGSAQH